MTVKFRIPDTPILSPRTMQTVLNLPTKRCEVSGNYRLLASNIVHNFKHTWGRKDRVSGTSSAGPGQVEPFANTVFRMPRDAPKTIIMDTIISRRTQNTRRRRRRHKTQALTKVTTHVIPSGPPSPHPPSWRCYQSFRTPSDCLPKVFPSAFPPRPPVAIF